MQSAVATRSISYCNVETNSVFRDKGLPHVADKITLRECVYAYACASVVDKCMWLAHRASHPNRHVSHTCAASMQDIEWWLSSFLSSETAWMYQVRSCPSFPERTSAIIYIVPCQQTPAFPKKSTCVSRSNIISHFIFQSDISTNVCGSSWRVSKICCFLLISW